MNLMLQLLQQESLLDIMQTREELYEVLDYYNFEKKLDDKLSKE